MTLFELVKQTILVRDAAEHYGLQVNRSGMCRCPFHDDRHPSMKDVYKRQGCSSGTWFNVFQQSDL